VLRELEEDALPMPPRSPSPVPATPAEEAPILEIQAEESLVLATPAEISAPIPPEQLNSQVPSSSIYSVCPVHSACCMRSL
jgi:hypothetical protein